MKKATFWVALAMTIVMFASCGGDKTDKPSSNADSAAQAEASNDTTVYGICQDGSMHHFSLKLDDGTVMGFTKDVDNSVSVVFGGLLDNDELAVTYYIDKENVDTVATRVINLTTLLAHWQSVDRDFELQKGGAIKSNQPVETNAWTSWHIHNGHLVLNQDTFDITLLSEDSLYLDNGKGIYDFARVKATPKK